MPQKRFTPEEIIHKRRHADVLLGQGKKVAEVVRRHLIQAQQLVNLVGCVARGIARLRVGCQLMRLSV